MRNADCGFGYQRNAVKVVGNADVFGVHAAVRVWYAGGGVVPVAKRERKSGYRIAKDGERGSFASATAHELALHFEVAVPFLKAVLRGDEDLLCVCVKCVNSVASADDRSVALRYAGDYRAGFY